MIVLEEAPVFDGFIEQFFQVHYKTTQKVGDVFEKKFLEPKAYTLCALAQVPLMRLKFGGIYKSAVSSWLNDIGSSNLQWIVYFSF